MADFDITSSLSVTSQNKMQTKVNVIGVGESELTSHIQANVHSNLDVFLNVYADNVIEDRLYGNQRKSSLLVSYRDDLVSSLGIPPYGKMSVNVEVQPPRTITVQVCGADSFVRDQAQTLNYGSEQSFIVGYSQSYEENYRSLLYFDHSIVPKGVDLKRATLKMNQTRRLQTKATIGVFQALGTWQENGVTWKNQPASGELITSADITQLGKLEIDITNGFTKWHTGEQNNYGIILDAIETNGDFVEFTSRESNNDPILEIEYYDPVVYSLGRTEITGNATVKQSNEKQFTGSITVKKIREDLDFESSIHVLNPNMIESNIIVVREKIPATLIVRSYGETQIDAFITIRQKAVREFPASVLVSRPEMTGKAIVPYRKDITTDMTVQRSDLRQIDGSVLVSRDFMSADIMVLQVGDSTIDGSLEVRQDENNDLVSDILVSRPDLMGSIQPVVSYYVDGSITVRQKQTNSMNGSIIIPYRKDLKGNINVVYKSLLPSSIEIRSKFLSGTITVAPYFDMPSNIEVRIRWAKDIETSLTIGGLSIKSYAFII